MIRQFELVERVQSYDPDADEEMLLDTSSIVTGLLHDTLEDTDATRDEISRLFGEDIARLVDGVTKLSRLEVQSETTKEAENLDLYAPLASRIGMENIKRELEELAFAELNPDGRASVLARQGYLRERGERLVPQIEAELIKTLKDGGLEAQVSGREKTPYSIWRKMQTKNVSFEQLADIMAFRIIVADVAQCYQALGLLHGRYQVLPQRFKDYISVPKPN